MAGRAQVNMWLPNLFVDYPLIDNFHLADRPWECTSATEDYWELMQANGYPSRMPSGSSPVYSVSMLLPLVSDTWVVTWDGGPVTLTLSVPTSGVSSSRTLNQANRQEWTITSATRPLHSNVRVTPQITAITSPISNLKIFRKSQETLLNAGNKFNPDFLSLYSGLGRIRFMDWGYTNVNPNTRWEYRTQESQPFWQGFNIITDVYCGACTRSGTDYTAPHGPNGNPSKSSWSHGDLVQAVLPSAFPAPLTIISFAQGVNPNVNVTAHGFLTGNRVYFTGFTASSLASTPNFSNKTDGKFWTITVVDPNNFTVDVMNSTGWGSAAGGTVQKQVTLAAGSLPTKPLLSNAIGSVGRSDLVNSPGALFNLYYDSDYDGLKLSLVNGNASAPLGFPLETMIDLANELQIDPWFCIPTCVDTNYVTNWATQIRDELDAGLVASLEYSNEVWNIGGGLIPTGFCLQKGKLYNSGTLLGTDCYNNFYGFTFYSMMLAVGSVFSGQMNRINRVMGMFTAGSTTASVLAVRLQATDASPAAFPVSLADSLALAPYLESRRTDTANAQYVYTNKVSRGDLTAMTFLDGKLRTVDSTNFTLDYCAGTLFPNWKTLANAPASGVGPVTLTMYEGGWGYIPSLNPLTASTYLGNALLATSLSVSNALNNGSGLIRLTVSSTATLVNGQPYWIGGVLGTSEANGFWTVTVIDGTHIDLVGSTFTNTYVGSGQVLSDRDNFYFDYYGTELFAKLLREYLDGFLADGGEYPSQYTFTGTWGSSTMWGLIQPNMYGDQTAACVAFLLWNAMVEFNNPSQAPVTGPGGVITAGWFSKKKWHELKAQLEAKERSKILKKHDQRKTLIEARKAADAVIQDAEFANRQQQEAIRADMERMETALKSAASARSVATIIEQANKASVLAEAIKLKLEDDEEEEAVAMLMLDS